MAKRTFGSPAAGYTVQWYADEILQAVDGEIDDALFEAVNELVERARAAAPRDKGTLQESGYASSTTKSTYVRRPYHKGQRKPSHGVAVAAFSAPHSHLVEWGTRKMRAQPYFRPAFDSGKEAMANAAVVKLRERLNRLRKG